MATINEFEDIKAWQQARLFTQWLTTIVNETGLATDYKLRQQIEGASGSIMDNIAEGFERGGNKEFINFLTYAKGSSGETRSQLYRVFDKGYITEAEFTEKRQELKDISSMIAGFIKYLKQSEHKGWKFMEDQADYNAVDELNPEE